MTDKLQEAAQIALNALEQIHRDNMTTIAEENWSKAIEALRAALAQPEREWQGLTDEERQECLYSDPIFGIAASTFARAIEAKLKEKNT